MGASHPTIARITAECASGGFDYRWGILWKSLKCSLDNAALIIERSTHIHTLLVDYRESK